MLNEEAKKRLKEAGWYAGRKINIDHILECCESEGFIVFDAVKKVLEEFGDLILTEPKSGLKHNFEVCEMYSDEYEGGMYAILERVLKEKVLEVASIYSGQFYMYVSESGKIYYDDGIIADNIYTAINKLLNTLSGEEVDKSQKLWKDLNIDIFAR